VDRTEEPAGSRTVRSLTQCGLNCVIYYSLLEMCGGAFAKAHSVNASPGVEMQLLKPVPRRNPSCSARVLKR